MAQTFWGGRVRAYPKCPVCNEPLSTAFSFPQEETRKRLWLDHLHLDNARRAALETRIASVQRVSICHRHFAEADIVGTAERPRLRFDAAPIDVHTKHPWHSHYSSRCDRHMSHTLNHNQFPCRRWKRSRCGSSRRPPWPSGHRNRPTTQTMKFILRSQYYDKKRRSIS